MYGERRPCAETSLREHESRLKCRPTRLRTYVATLETVEATASVKHAPLLEAKKSIGRQRKDATLYVIESLGAIEFYHKLFARLYAT
jgi:hypothetical protein